MTRSRNLRLYRACVRCRQRKLKCEPSSPGENGKSQCFECFRAGDECTPAGSRRGGNYSHLRRSKQKSRATTVAISSPHNSESTGSWHGDTDGANAAIDDSHPGEPIYAELKNPCDALQILAKLAADDNRPEAPNNNQESPNELCSDRQLSDAHLGSAVGLGENAGVQPLHFPKQPSEAEVLTNDILGIPTAYQLVFNYAENYHPFCPLAPKAILKTKDIGKIAVEEPFLLTTIFTIASKDSPGYQEIHQRCWQSLKRHMLDVLLAVPSTLNVGSVEALILLSEWVPYQLPETGWDSKLYRNLSTVEDNMAWSLIGQAVRHSYLLHLDSASFREKVPGESQELEERKRLAWIFVYISDRQISVRMGQSFWSRGPSLSTRFTANDFPSLQLDEDSQHSYAFVLQATIELTQLLHNVHDILYSSKTRTLQMMLWGDYNRYLDDFRRALSTWQDSWGNLKASPKLRSTLRIVIEYVRLYVNAFSFQSILSRACVDKREGATGASSSIRDRATSLFPRGIMASADGAYIFEAVNAAKNVLTIVTETDPAAHIRYMPFRFYVYTIYSAVFLYKADVFGAFPPAEQNDVIELVKRFIHTLDDAATSESHMGCRYSKLLKRLWFNEKTSTASPSNGQKESQINPELFSTASKENPPQTTIDAILNGTGYEIPPYMDWPAPEAIVGSIPDFNPFSSGFGSLETELFNDPGSIARMGFGI